MNSVHWTAFFCSVRCPGGIILKSYDLAQKWRAEGQAVIGGFHSPVEKEVLKIMLRSTAQVCIVLARGQPKRIPSEFRKPIDDGRMILASPFDGRTKRATAETALERNKIIATQADKIFVAYAAPGSKTETLCRTIFKWNQPCFTFQHEANENLLSLGFIAIDGNVMSNSRVD
ncbi:MAG: DNA-binding protein [Kiritimatiellia bacterium]|nr:DNA-binding protein [Kiritimatiellia bacterium]